MESAVLDVPIPLAEIAKTFGVGQLAVWKWKKLGRLNHFTGERVYAQMTWLPGGKWGMTQQQISDFLTRLNEKP